MRWLYYRFSQINHINTKLISTHINAYACSLFHLNNIWADTKKKEESHFIDGLYVLNILLDQKIGNNHINNKQKIQSEIHIAH